jgi:branched-chain amino acid transport system permease protein
VGYERRRHLFHLPRIPMSLQLLANVAVLAAIYALVSTGYILIYRVSRVLNLAHGELMMMGAYLLVAAAGLFSGDPLIALVLAAICGLIMGIVVYVVLMRWMTGEAVLAAVLITIALGILLRGLAILIWTTQQFYPAASFGWRNPPVPIGPGVQISAASLAIIFLTLAVYAGLFVFLRFSPWGVRMRAAGQNPLLAEQRGIRLHGVYAFAWGLSTFTASLAGMLLALDSGVESTMATIGLKAFPAALVGGLDSLLGAALGAVIVAAAEIAAIQYVNPLLSDVVPFVVLLIVLAIRPWGLLGSREQLDRV